MKVISCQPFRSPDRGVNMDDDMVRVTLECTLQEFREISREPQTKERTFAGIITVMEQQTEDEWRARRMIKIFPASATFKEVEAWAKLVRGPNFGFEDVDMATVDE